MSHASSVVQLRGECFQSFSATCDVAAMLQSRWSRVDTNCCARAVHTLPHNACSSRMVVCPPAVFPPFPLHFLCPVFQLVLTSLHRFQQLCGLSRVLWSCICSCQTPQTRFLKTEKGATRQEPQCQESEVGKIDERSATSATSFSWKQV